MTQGKTEEELISEISAATSEVLAAHVVVYRSLGINKNLSVSCMQELMKRRSDGDEFDFESYIDEKVAEIPQLKNMNLAKVTEDIQKQVRSLNGRQPFKFNNSKNSS